MPVICSQKCMSTLICLQSDGCFFTVKIIRGVGGLGAGNMFSEMYVYSDMSTK